MMPTIDGDHKFIPTYPTYDEYTRLRQRVEELERSILRHFQEEHLAGDGPDIDRWKREMERLTLHTYAVRQRSEAAEAKLAEAQKRIETFEESSAADQRNANRAWAEVERLRKIVMAVFP